MVALSSTGSSGALAKKKRYGVLVHDSAFKIGTTEATSSPLNITEFSEIAVKANGAGVVTVYGSEDDITYVLIDSLTPNLVADKWVVIDLTKIGPFGFIKLVRAAGGRTYDVVGKT